MIRGAERRVTFRPPQSDRWMRRAGCRDVDTELFFPAGSSGPAVPQIAKAKAVCTPCPVRAECLSWALSTGQDDGIWGGMTDQERRSAQKLMKTAGAQG